MKTLITGGAGFIGSHTIVELVAAGHTPVIVDNFSNSERWIINRIAELTGKAPILYEGDCTDPAFLSNVFVKEGDIKGVIHFAAYKAVGDSVAQPLAYYRNNINALITLLEVMQQQGVRNLVFSSSATVYGDTTNNPIPETAPRKEAMSPYGNTKMICEDIIRDTTKSGTLRAIVLRYFNPIGAHPSGRIGELPIGVPNNLVPYVTQAAAGKRDTLTIFGDDYNTPDGTCVRDYVHVVDLARAHIASLAQVTKKEQAYEVFNVGTGQGTSVRTLVETFEKVNKVKIPYTVGPRREGDVAVCFAKVDKIQNEMDWCCTHSLEDALRDAWRWQEMGIEQRQMQSS